MIFEVYKDNLGAKWLYGNYGKLEIRVPLDFGIRILGFNLKGGPNLLQESKESVETLNGSWCFYGGHRLWTAPEKDPETYSYDGAPISYMINNNRVTLEQPMDTFTKLQKQITLEFLDDQTLRIKHRIKNNNRVTAKIALWAVTMMKSGGTHIIPFYGKDTGLLNDRVISLWPGTRLNDQRISFYKDFIFVEHKQTIASELKIGINNLAGFGAYYYHNHLFVKRFKPIDHKDYPDNNVSYECYASGKLTESESLSHLTNLSKGQSAEYIEDWQIFYLSENPSSYDVADNLENILASERRNDDEKNFSIR
jgi:hypothetical protein